MIPPKIKAIFQFIEYLHSNIDNSKKYDDVIKDKESLRVEMNKLSPKENFKDKLKYDEIQKQYKVKAKIIKENILDPIWSKVDELKIFDLKDLENTLYNWNSSEVHELIRNFSNEDLPEILSHKNKYLQYRTETKDELIYGLGFFYDFDQTLKPLFDYFKESDLNEFEPFETKTIQVKDVNELVNLLLQPQKILIESSPPPQKNKTPTLSVQITHVKREEIAKAIKEKYSSYKGKDFKILFEALLKLDLFSKYRSRSLFFRCLQNEGYGINSSQMLEDQYFKVGSLLKNDEYQASEDEIQRDLIVEYLKSVIDYQ